jgi:diaminohydroxyphosphoribosylaminopyrimidine deaminase / 5-amino-6-(5-phosphoribosylamino)uracil reductase
MRVIEKMDKDTIFMNEAISLARQAIGRTAPNPSVGALVVKDGRVVGRGFHPQAGKPHAEIYALEEAGEHAHGAVLYVTLEPCAHFGKTPPCTDAVMKAGISRVVVGAVDPNPIVAGKGIERLKRAGITVDVGACAQECTDLIAWYAFWIRNSRPYVILKAAITLDGRVASSTGDSQWISSEESRRHVHELRNRVDGLIVGIGTVLKDDPLLTCRIEGGRDPMRIVLDPQFEIPADAKCLGDGSLVFTAGSSAARPEITARGPEIVRIKADPAGLLPWASLLEHLGKMGLHCVMVEGGSGIYSSLLRSGLVDKLLFFIAPKILGGGLPLVDWGSPSRIADSLKVVITKVGLSGGDIIAEGKLGG